MSNYRITDELEVPVPPYQLWRATLASAPEEKINPMAAALEKAGVTKKEKEKSPSELMMESREVVSEAVERIMNNEKLTDDQKNQKVQKINAVLSELLDNLSKIPESPTKAAQPETEKTAILPRMKTEKSNEEVQVVEKEGKTKTFRYTKEEPQKLDSVDAERAALEKRIADAEKSGDTKTANELREKQLKRYVEFEERREAERRKAERRTEPEQRQTERRQDDRRQAEAVIEDYDLDAEKEQAKRIVAAKERRMKEPGQVEQQFAEVKKETKGNIEEVLDVGNETIYKKPAEKKESFNDDLKQAEADEDATLKAFQAAGGKPGSEEEKRFIEASRRVATITELLKQESSSNKNEALYELREAEAEEATATEEYKKSGSKPGSLEERKMLMAIEKVEQLKELAKPDATPKLAKLGKRDRIEVLERSIDDAQLRGDTETERFLKKELDTLQSEVGSETIYHPAKKEKKEKIPPLDADDAARQQLGAYPAPRHTSKEFKTPVAPIEAAPEPEKAAKPAKEKTPEQPLTVEEQRKKLASDWKGVETRLHSQALKEDALRTAEKEEKLRPLKELREKTEAAEQAFKNAVEQRLYQSDKAQFEKALKLASDLRNEYSAALEASDLPVTRGPAELPPQPPQTPPTPPQAPPQPPTTPPQPPQPPQAPPTPAQTPPQPPQHPQGIPGRRNLIAEGFRSLWENSKLKFTMDSAYSQVLAQMYNQIAATKHGDLRRATAEYEARQKKSEELEAKVRANPMDTSLLREAKKAAIRARESEQKLKRIDTTLDKWEKLRKNECDQIAIRIEMRLRPYEETIKDCQKLYKDAENILDTWQKQLKDQEQLLAEAVAEGQRTAKWFGLIISPAAQAKIDAIKKNHMAVRLQILGCTQKMNTLNARMVRAEKKAEPWRVIKEEVNQLARPLGRKAVKPLNTTP